jgi:hypothetical protein
VLDKYGKQTVLDILFGHPVLDRSRERVETFTAGVQLQCGV